MNGISTIPVFALTQRVLVVCAMFAPLNASPLLSQGTRITSTDRLIKQIRIGTDKLSIAVSDGEVKQRLATTRADQLNKLVKVWIAGVDIDEFPAVAGKVSISEDGEVVFTPRFPFRPGKSYTVLFSWFGTDLKKTVEVPLSKSIPTTIAAIYPSADSIPENNLKFYVHFSAPMQKGDVYRFVSLRDAKTGKPVELPFLELEQELWSRDSTRLTLLLDPGRIKKGLRPRTEVGPVFLPDRDYELVINGQWPDHQGLPLGNNTVKKFRTTEYDETQPNPQLWKIVAPKPGSKDPLQIKFDEALDHSMLNRVITVIAPTGLQLQGDIVVTGGEKAWRFRPDIEWVAGNYAVEIDNALEDLAGNSIGKMFDVDVFGRPDGVPDSGKTRLSFEIN